MLYIYRHCPRWGFVRCSLFACASLFIFLYLCMWSHCNFQMCMVYVHVLISHALILLFAVCVGLCVIGYYAGPRIILYFFRWTFATICTLHANSGWPLNLSCAKCCEAKQIFSCGHSFCLCYEQFFLLLLTSVNGVSALCSLCLLVQAHMHYISCQYASFFMALFVYSVFVCENI